MRLFSHFCCFPCNYVGFGFRFRFGFVCQIRIRYYTSTAPDRDGIGPPYLVLTFGKAGPQMSTAQTWLPTVQGERGGRGTQVLYKSSTTTVLGIREWVHLGLGDSSTLHGGRLSAIVVGEQNKCRTLPSGCRGRVVPSSKFNVGVFKVQFNATSSKVNVDCSKFNSNLFVHVK